MYERVTVFTSSICLPPARINQFCYHDTRQVYWPALKDNGPANLGVVGEIWIDVEEDRHVDSFTRLHAAPQTAISLKIYMLTQ